MLNGVLLVCFPDVAVEVGLLAMGCLSAQFQQQPGLCSTSPKAASQTSGLVMLAFYNQGSVKKMVFLKKSILKRSNDRVPHGHFGL